MKDDEQQNENRNESCCSRHEKKLNVYGLVLIVVEKQIMIYSCIEK